MSAIDSLLDNIVSLTKKVRSLKTKSEELKKIISSPNYKKMLLNGSHKELFEFIFNLMNECPPKEIIICGSLIDFIESSATCGYIPPVLYDAAVECVLSSFKYTANTTLNTSIIKCVSTFIISQTHHIHSELLLRAFRVIFDATLLLNIHESSISSAINNLTQLIGVIVMKMEMANSVIDEEKENKRSSISSPVINDILPCFYDSIELLHYLYSLTTTHWTQRSTVDTTFKTFLSTITNEAKETLDLKCQLHSLRLISTWLDTFSPTLRSCNSFKKVIEDNKSFYQDIQECLILSSTDELLFDESILLVKSIMKHKVLFKGLLNEVFHVIYIPLLRHPIIFPTMKLKILELLNFVCEKNAFCEIYINCDCELYGENIITEMICVLLYLVENEQDYSVKHSAINTLRQVIKSFRKEVTEPPKGDFNIHELLALKQKYNDIKTIFKENAKKGIELFKEGGFCGESVEDIVEFFTKNVDLDKVAIGDYVGKHDEFNQQVLKACINSLDFKDKEIDEGLRMVFNLFVMGGESQVVDRVMECFGNHYFECNKERLTKMSLNAVNIYQLATSVIFLSTESHNPSAKTKAMDTFEKFKEVINSGFGLSIEENILKGIYERTTKEAFHLPKISIVQQINETNKNEFQGKKRILQIKSDLEKMKDYCIAKLKGSTFTPFVLEKSTLVPLKLYETIAVPLAESIERTFENIDKIEDIKLVLQGLIDTIHMSCILRHETKPQIIKALLVITHLDVVNTISQRNVMAVETLIDVCVTDFEYLEDCWEDCLQVILKMERLHMLASGWKEESNKVPIKEQRIKRFEYSSDYKGPVKERVLLTENVPQCILDIGDVELGSVYNTIDFSDEAIVYFFKGLCGAATKELEAPIPRIYILQKLVISAEANIGRSEIVFQKIWRYLVPFYIRCGLHPIEDVAMSVLDNLRQLTMKSMMSQEVSVENQKEFLKPFVVIISDHPSVNVREFVIQVLQQILTNKRCGENLKSGWETIFDIVLFASVDEARVSILAFQFFKQVYKLFEKCPYYEKYFFLFLRCLKSFGRLESVEEVGLQVNSLIQMILTNFFVGKKEVELNDNCYRNIIPMFKVLSTNIHSLYISVATNSIEIFFGLLRSIGNVTSHELMETILTDCILPLFTTDISNQWVSNIFEILFVATLDFLLEQHEYCMLLVDLIEFAFYVIFHEGPAFSSAALSFINQFIGGVANTNDTILMHSFIEKFSVFCTSVVQFIPIYNEYQSDKTTEVNLTKEKQLKGNCMICMKEVISEYLMTCPICGKQKYCCEECYIKDTQSHKKICLQQVKLKHLSLVTGQEFTQSLPQFTSSLIEKISGINNVSQALFALFNILTKIISDDDMVILFTQLTNVFNELFTLFNKHPEDVSSLVKSETLIEIYDLYVVQLFEMYLNIFTSDKHHRELMSELYFLFAQTLLKCYVDNKCEYSLSITKSVIISITNQLIKITNDTVYYQIVDFLYDYFIDMISTKDEDLREILRLLLHKHRTIQTNELKKK
ncbi:hypothetical protein ENUP19_0158G0029 [Entamoeba nuttalli]